MITKIVIASLFSVSLLAMQYNKHEMVVSLGDNREAIPLTDVMRFKSLTERLIKYGHETKDDGTWVYGQDDEAFPLEEKEALWVANNINQQGRFAMHYHNPVAYYPQSGQEELIEIPLSVLWKIARYVYEWKESAPNAVGTKIVEHLIKYEKIEYPPFPSSKGWDSRHYLATYAWQDPYYDWEGYFVELYPGGEMKWHNHRKCDTPIHCWNGCMPQSIVPSFATRYWQETHNPGEEVFTKDHLQDFCNNKAVKEVALDEREKILIITCMDDTSLHLQRVETKSKYVSEQYGYPYTKVDPQWKVAADKSK